MAGGDGRYARRILGCGIAAPHHMQIGADKDEIALVDFPRSCVIDFGHRHRRAAIAQRVL